MNYIPEGFDDDHLTWWHDEYMSQDNLSDNPYDWMEAAWMEAVRILVDQYCITRAKVARQDLAWDRRKARDWDG